MVRTRVRMLLVGLLGLGIRGLHIEVQSRRLEVGYRVWLGSRIREYGYIKQYC